MSRRRRAGCTLEPFFETSLVGGEIEERRDQVKRPELHGRTDPGVGGFCFLFCSVPFCSVPALFRFVSIFLSCETDLGYV